MINIILIAIVYLLIGTLISAKHIGKYMKGIKSEERAEVIHHMALSWPLHVCVMIGIKLSWFFEND